MKLRRNQYCSIHRSLTCCGREPVSKERRVRRLGVQHIEDSQPSASFAPKRKCGNCSIEKVTGPGRSVG
jgi:hypothetical protein